MDAEPNDVFIVMYSHMILFKVFILEEDEKNPPRTFFLFLSSKLALSPLLSSLSLDSSLSSSSLLSLGNGRKQTLVTLAWICF